LTQPAEEPGTPLEPSGNCRPREMVTHDRIRLTGLLRKKPWKRGFFYACLLAGDSSCSPRAGPDDGLHGTARRGRPAWPRRPCRLRAAPQTKTNMTRGLLRSTRQPATATVSTALPGATKRSAAGAWSESSHPRLARSGDPMAGEHANRRRPAPTSAPAASRSMGVKSRR